MIGGDSLNLPANLRSEICAQFLWNALGSRRKGAVQAAAEPMFRCGDGRRWPKGRSSAVSGSTKPRFFLVSMRAISAIDV
jgi:hypothetical protein